jgi:hypothetical protein
MGQPEPQPKRDNADDDSSRSHRQLIGWIGLLLPALLWVFAGLRPNDPASAWRPLGSISAYFYTSAAFAFVGMLAALALFLFAYRGFRNRWQAWDKGVARTAAFAAIVVAAFPTFSPSEALRAPWWRDWFATAHYAAAVLLFLMFAVFSLWLFTRSEPSGVRAPDKTWRNTVYVVCGLAILISIAWAAFEGMNNRSIFLPESVALIAFAMSWLVKGSIHKTVAEALKPDSGR